MMFCGAGRGRPGHMPLIISVSISFMSLNTSRGCIKEPVSEKELLNRLRRGQCLLAGLAQGSPRAWAGACILRLRLPRLGIV